MQNVLSVAIGKHQGGQLGQAAQLYRKVLACEPENAEALHLYGVLYHQKGDHSRASILIGRAVSLRPDASLYRANLAEAFRSLGDFERAESCCLSALQIWPDYPEALCNLGAALQGMGRQAESIEKFRRALELRPNFAVARNNLGTALRELGQMGKALVQFRRAVELDPTFAPAQTNLGQLLLDRGRAEDALVFAQEAVRLDPTSAVVHHNLGNVLRVLDRLDDARVAYLKALRLNRKLAPANAHLGLVLKGKGRLNIALFWLKKAVELEPANSTFWEWLAEVHEEMEEYAEAIPCRERVLDLDPEQAGPHLSLGWDLQEVGRFDVAREHFLTAIRLQPNSGLARLSLGGVCEELGQMGEAEAAFRESLRLQPNLPLPHGRLATLLRGKLPDADLTALEERLADEKLDQLPRARLLFGLAHALDGRGDYHRAAECVREANSISLELVRERREYMPAEHERYVEGMMRAFDRDLVVRLAGVGSDSRRPVFVIGLPRSGTTLIEQVLASHSQIHGAGELRLARRSFESIPTLLSRPGPPCDCVVQLDSAVLARLASQHLDSLAAIDSGQAARIVDKMPDNYMYLGLLSSMFPRAVFVHCRRDLRDVAVSCWMTDFRSVRWANSQDHIASRFHQYRRVMDHWRAVLTVPMVEVDYEETVSDLESVARRLVGACGLEWEPACLEFYRTERPVRTASLTQVRQPIYQRSVARWKNYEAVLVDFFAALPLG